MMQVTHQAQGTKVGKRGPANISLTFSSTLERTVTKGLTKEHSKAERPCGGGPSGTIENVRIARQGKNSHIAMTIEGFDASNQLVVVTAVDQDLQKQRQFRVRDGGGEKLGGKEDGENARQTQKLEDAYLMARIAAKKNSNWRILAYSS